MIFLSLRVTADAEGGLKIRAQLRPDLQGFGGGQPPTSTRRVYTGALLAATITIGYFGECNLLEMFSGKLLDVIPNPYAKMLHIKLIGGQ